MKAKKISREFQGRTSRVSDKETLGVCFLKALILKELFNTHS
jgi:hypothetical protein